MRFGSNSGARKVQHCKCKTLKYYLRFCGTVNNEGHSFRKGGALQVVKTEIRLWYFCGQTRNCRSFHCGNFQFWWTVRGSNPRPRRCERRALPNATQYGPIFKGQTGLLVGAEGACVSHGVRPGMRTIGDCFSTASLIVQFDKADSCLFTF